MKKLAVFLASLLVLILIVFVGLPGLLGSQVENRLFEVIDEEFYGDYIELELIDFDKGWFRSKARLSAKPAGALAAVTALSNTKGEAIIFDVDLVHGPVLFGHALGFGLARFENTSELPMPAEMFDGDPGTFNLKTAMTLRLDGSTDLAVSSQGRHYSLVDRSSFRPEEIRTRFELDWSGFDSQFSMTSGGGNLALVIDLPNGLFEVTEKDITSPIKYGAMHLEGDYEMWNGYPAFGTGFFTWEGLDIDIPDPAVNLKFSMQRMFVSGETARANGQVSYRSDLELRGIHMNNAAVAPIEVETTDLNMLLSGVSEAVYGELIALQRQMTLAAMGVAGSREAERRGEALANQFFGDGFEFDVPAFDVVMAPGAMHYNHIFKVAAGAIEDINDPASAMAMEFFAEFWIDRSLAIWMAEFTTRIQMSMFGGQPSPQELREAAEQMIGQLISEGYLQESGDRLETKIIMKDGLFSIGRKVVEDFSGA